MLGIHIFTAGPDYRRFTIIIDFDIGLHHAHEEQFQIYFLISYMMSTDESASVNPSNYQIMWVEH